MNESPEISSEIILRDAANADLALTVARWVVRHWDVLPALQRSQLIYCLDYGGRFVDGDVLFSVPLRWLLEGIQAVRKCGEEDDVKTLDTRL